VAEKRELSQGEVVIGRSSSCDLVLDDSAVSRGHARIEINGETVVSHDLSSRSGTWVNGGERRS
jgi:pSer/pThr/pTyr-binding forkhead associated (FHA) protein